MNQPLKDHTVVTDFALRQLEGKTVPMKDGERDQVMGHGTIVKAEQEGDALKLTVDVPDMLAAMLFPYGKGSYSIDKSYGRTLR